MGKTSHRVWNIKHFCEELREVMIVDGDMFASHNLVSLFTNTLIDKSVEYSMRKTGTGHHIEESLTWAK